MAKHGFGGPLFVAQGNYIEQNTRDEALKKEYGNVYRLVVHKLRECYGINHGMPNYAAQLLVDEVAMATVRIQEMEQWLRKTFQDSEQWDKEMEGAVQRLKEQRGKSIERLVYLTGGKRVAKLRSGKMSYRDKMNRSKKLQQVQRIEEVVGKENDESEVGEADDFEDSQGQEPTRGSAEPTEMGP